MRQQVGNSVVVAQIGHHARNMALLVILVVIAACSQPQPSGAAPFAAYVMDARTGEELYSRNADTRLHPASLTKMMTLYIAFQDIEAGRISPDTMITVSANAADEPPSRLGLRSGQKIALRYLIRAAAVKSANDAATAIGDHIGGSEAAFARRMTETARALGMTSTAFRNANGLTRDGHLSTAHDMSILGRHLFYDFPQYYNIFSRRSTDAGLAEVNNTNRRFLDAYKGADGIKTGFTNAAGFNLTASAERGGVRIIATVFGGTSTAARNAKVAELLDLGFSRAPRNAPVTAPQAPGLIAVDDMPAATAEDAAVAAAMADASQATSAGKTIRLVTTLTTSLRPRARPGTQTAPDQSATQLATADTAATEDAVLAMQDEIAGALAEAMGEELPAPANTDAPPTVVAEAAPSETPREEVAPTTDLALTAPPAPESLDAQALVLTGSGAPDTASVGVVPLELASALAPTPRPERRAPIFDSPEDETALAVAAPADDAALVVPEEVVLVMSTSGGRDWGVNVGRFSSRSEAERALLRTQLAESATLDESLRKVTERSGGYDANFLGLSREQADLACRRLQARAIQCFTIGE